MKSKYFRREFLQNLPGDDDEAIIAISQEYESLFREYGSAPSLAHDFLEAYALVEAFTTARKIEVIMPTVTSADISRPDLLAVLRTLKNSAEKRKSERTAKEHFSIKRDEYAAFFSQTPVYEFSDDEFFRIQELINVLRTDISNSVLITTDHKRRLLRRLEAMQGELHKKTSDIDRFWGFIAEAGIVARKFGEDLKPINERVIELGKIVTKVILTKEGINKLPEISKILQLE